MDRRRGHEGVDAAALGVLHRLACPVDVGIDGAGQPGDDRPIGARLAISLTASKSPLEAIGKPASMMSTPMVFKQFGDLELFLQRHGRTGRLLAVTQGGVEDVLCDLIGRTAGAQGLIRSLSDF
jgi:hypothetical protein